MQKRTSQVPRGTSQSSAHINEFILKVASRCNLNCTYCYMYNKGDQSWMDRPRIMSDMTFCSTIINIAEHCRYFGLDHVSIMFHGGEPTLVGVDRFDRWCRIIRDSLCGIDVKLAIQTNGTLLDARWVRALATHDVGVGISMDGPQELHDVARVDHQGRGSHTDVMTGIAALHAGGVPFGLLCVAPLGIVDPVRVHRHFVEQGAASIGSSFPTTPMTRSARSVTATARTPSLTSWFRYLTTGGTTETSSLRVSPFWEMARAIRGGDSG